MREQIAQQPPLKRRASAEKGQPVQHRRSGIASSPASVHRAGHYVGIHLEDMPHQSGQLTQEEEDDVPDSYYPQLMPSSAIRYRTTGEEEIVRGNKRLIIHRGAPPKRQHAHPLLIVGITMSVVMAGVILLARAEIWWTNQQNTWTYGYPRIYQTDAVVGHNDSPLHESHFIVLNLNGHIQVIEIPGGDPAHEKVYIGPILFNDDAGLVPVTVSFRDMNGDGKPDMLIRIQDQTIIFLNDGTQFKASKQ
jgi:hypothetical protein